MLRLLRGSVSVEAPWEETRSLRIEIVVGPGTEGEAWEIALDEFEGAWTPAASEPAFPRIVRRRQREFATWLRQQPAIPQPLKKARALAAYVTWSALVDPAGNIGREAMLMSKNWMVNVWSWDHCFNAIALAERQPALAWDQWAMLFDHQHASGMLPDAINDRDVVWNFTKPPVHGWALGEMIARGFTPTPEQSRQAVRWLERWTNWWLEYRDDDHDGIPQYNHGNDSGWDNATLFGAGMPVEGPDLSTFLVLQMETVAALHARLGRKPAAARWRGRADALTQRLLGHSWRGGRFVGPRSGDHATADGDSLVAFMPLLLGRRLPQEVRERLVRGLAEPGRLLTRHGLATESPRSPLYRSDGYWRGPIWAPSTMLIVSGLQACGEHRLARTIAQRFCATFARSGSAENFDALSGAGLRDRAYTWTASVFIVLAGLLNGDRKTIPSR
jgi:glycogen debranching enzyme